MRGVYYIAGVLALILLGSVVLITGKEHPGYSVVYFDNSTIPTSLYLGNETTIVFGIRSYEHSRTSYFFDIYLNGKMIQNGSISLNPYQSIQIPVNLLVKNATYNKVITENITTSYQMNGVLNITTLCVLINSTGNWSCSPLIYKGPLGLSFILSKTGNVNINKTTYTTRGNTLLVTVQTLSIKKEGAQRYRVILRTLKWIRVRENVVLQIIVRSSTDKVYVLSRSFNVVGG